MLMENKHMSKIDNLNKELKNLGSPARAEHSKYFFKTGKGQYAEGDEFYGLTTPQMHQLVKKYRELSLDELWILLQDKMHECRMIALGILKLQFSAKEYLRGEIHQLYLKAAHENRINNWDLVDVSAELLVGSLCTNDISLLEKLAKSELLWERRIAMIATFYFLKNKDPRPTVIISQILIGDKHDLIHKACGWMLREMGKRCGENFLLDYLEKHIKIMPRTMLRYAIEKFPEEKRKYYLNYGKTSVK